MRHGARDILCLPVSLFVLAAVWMVLLPRAPTWSPLGEWFHVVSWPTDSGRPSDRLRWKLHMEPGGAARFTFPTKALEFLGVKMDDELGQMALRWAWTASEGYYLASPASGPGSTSRHGGHARGSDARPGHVPFSVRGDRLILDMFPERRPPLGDFELVFLRARSGRRATTCASRSRWSAVVQRLGRDPNDPNDSGEAELELLLAPGRSTMSAVLEGVAVSESRVKQGCLLYLQKTRGLEIDEEMRGALLKLERYYRPGVRASLTRALAHLLPRDPDVHALVFRTLEDADAYVRDAAAVAASWLEPSQFDRLREIAVKHPRSDVRHDALSGCGLCVQQGTQVGVASVESYRRLLLDRRENDPSEEVRASARLLLEDLGR